MKKDNIELLFENLKDEFDVEIPNSGHQERFLEKLTSKPDEKPDRVAIVYMKPLLAIAATLLLLLSLITLIDQKPIKNDLASVSPELSKTQDFFISTINYELVKLNKARSPETKALIDDAMEQMAILENNYNTLKKDLTVSGDDKRVIYAMISNYQNRINVLQNVLKDIEHIKHLKLNTNENAIIL